MQWSFQHITLSPRFPHGNAHAEKAVHVIKQIYQKANDVKLALLLLKIVHGDLSSFGILEDINVNT